MKKLLQSLFILGAFGQLALFAQAQTAPKILFVDMAKLYDGHWGATAERAKLKAAYQKAQGEFDQMIKDRDALVEQYKESDEQSNNPAATAEAKAKAKSQADQLIQQVRAKESDAAKFQDNVGRELRQRDQEIHNRFFEEIATVASDVAKREGATTLLDKSGLTTDGISPVIYSDPSLDITAEVAAEIAKSKPAPTPATPDATAPATPVPADAAAPAPAKN